MVGSHGLSGERAQALLDAVRARPMGADQPLPVCAVTREELMLVVDGGARVVRMPQDGCRQLLWDDGADNYEVTRTTCADLLVGPLWQSSFREEAQASQCAPMVPTGEPKR